MSNDEKPMIEIVKEQGKKLEELEAEANEQKKKKEKAFKFRIPAKLVRGVKKDPNKVVVLYIGPNRQMMWKSGMQKDGLWWVELGIKDKQSFAYEETSVFYLPKGKKTVPVIIVFSWRLLPVGGKAEEYYSRLLGGEKDQDIAKHLGIKSFGQQTIIRAIEQAELEKDEKKKGNFIWIIWIGLGIAALYFISKFFLK